MNLKSVKTVDVFSFEKRGEQTGLGLVINGIPYLLWTHVYQNLEVKPTHARDMIDRLEEGRHYLSLTNAEMKEMKTRLQVTCNLGFNSSVFYFINAEGFNRVIMDVDTSRMKDRKAARAIEERKNRMAEVFTKYEAGTLALPDKKPPRITGTVLVAPVFKDRKALGKSMGLNENTCVLVALDETEKITGADLSTYRNLMKSIPLVQASENYLTSAGVAAVFDVAKFRANVFLEQNGLLVRAGKEWALTEKGKKYGTIELITVTIGNRMIPRHTPRWSSEVITFLKKTNPIKGQKTLTT